MSIDANVENATKSGQRRKIVGLLVNKALIKRYVFLVVVIMMIASILIGFIINQTIKQTLENESRRAQKVGVYDVLMKVNNELLVRVFFVLFLSVIVTGVAGIMFLHRIAGPIYRIRSVLKAMADGKIPRTDVKLREGDFFMEVADELNRLIHKLRAKEQGG
ncbi:MAG TPA: hypothetical protein PKL97_04130 [Candidatus Omnitrophota bacterium]|nr:hypothetical protein [Candidatus Omnitrophota bacterium]